MINQRADLFDARFWMGSKTHEGREAETQILLQAVKRAELN